MRMKRGKLSPASGDGCGGKVLFHGVREMGAFKSENRHIKPLLGALDFFFFSFLKVIKFPSRFEDICLDI